jgi:hypothetical protein
VLELGIGTDGVPIDLAQTGSGFHVATMVEALPDAVLTAGSALFRGIVSRGRVHDRRTSGSPPIQLSCAEGTLSSRSWSPHLSRC